MSKTIALGMMLIAAAFLARGYTDQAGAGELTKQERMREKTCRYQWMDQGTWTVREESKTAACLLRRWAVPGGLSTFDRVIRCESGWNRMAYNPAGPYVGLGQHALSSWTARVRAYSPPLWNLSPRWQNSRTMITVTARMMHSVGLSPLELRMIAAAKEGT